jgi:dihydrolipoamide dehydrogenase
MTQTSGEATTHFDVVVLGAGPGGYTAAVRAAQLGRTVAVVEERFWGGVCLNIGCIPSKALLRNAELAHIFTTEAEKFGITVDGTVRVDYGPAYDRSRQVADGRVKGVNFLMKKNNITQFNGRGNFVDPNTLRVDLTDGGSQTITFANCIIAVGATTRLIPGTAKSDRVVTYEEQILSNELPGSVIIAGSGAIGVEFGYIMRSYGVDVTIVEFLDRLVPLEDAEVSAELARRFRRLGITTHTSTAVESIDDSGDKVRVTVSSNGQRRASDVDGRLRTSVPHIFAIGDVTAKLMLAHAAESMGIVAAETIAGAETMELDYVMIPRATFCQPQIASFGWTEDQARQKGLDIKVVKFPFTANGKAQGLGEPAGFVKIIADTQRGELLGAHLIGAEVTELLPELTLAQLWDLTVFELARNVHAHPTHSEAVKEALHGQAGHMINM